MIKFLLGIFAFFLIGCANNLTRSSCDKSMDLITREYQKLARKQGLILAGSGGGIKNEKVAQLAVTFDVKEVMTIQSARDRIIGATLLLQDVIRSNLGYLDCFEQDKPLVQYLNIAILGHEGTDPKAAYISAVSISKGIIYYNKIDPEGKIKPYIHIHRETYEEALSIVQNPKNDLEF